MPRKRARATHREEEGLFASLAALETDFEAAWNASPRKAGRFVGQPSIAGRGSSTPSTRESARRPVTGRGSRRPPLGRARGPREMARCMRVIRRGDWPE